MAGVDPLTALHRPRAGQPAYRQIEEQLRELIEAGALEVGDRVPPERDLAVRLGVSRMTLRQALDGLVRRGLLERSTGRGTHVARPKVEQDLRVLRTYPDELRTQGAEPRTAVVDAGEEPAPRRVAATLGLRPGASACRIVRLRSAVAAPLLYETTWLDAERFGAVLRADLTGSLWDLLASLGAPVVRAVEQLEPVVAGAHDAEMLEVARGAPLMLVERLAYGAGDDPLEFAVGVFRGDRTRFTVEIPARGGASIGQTPRP